MKSPFCFEEIKKVTKNINLQTPKFISGKDGINLAHYIFLPKSEPQNIIIFYHGAGIWSNRAYQYMAQQCVNQNIGIYLFDVRGHGRSGGPRGDAPSSGAVWGDVDTAIKYVRKIHASAKIFLGGHSAGSGLILNYSALSEATELNNISGYFLVTPYLGSRSKANINHTDSSKKFVKKVNLFKLLINMLFRGYFFENEHVIYFNYAGNTDSFVLRSYTCSMAKAISIGDQKKVFESINKPIAVFVGSDDEMFIPEQIMSYASYSKSSKLITEIVPKAKHLSILADADQLFLSALRKWEFIL